MNEFYDVISKPDKKSKYTKINDILPPRQRGRDYDMRTSFGLNIPTDLIFEISMDCCVDCLYCYADREHKYTSLSYEFVEKFMNEAIFELQMRDIGISGGDIFLYEHKYKLLKLLSDNGYYPELPTKKPLTEKELLFLKNQGFKSFQYSIDSFNENTIKQHLNISDPGKYLKDMQNSIRLASELGLKVSLNSVITKYNFKEIGTFLDKALKYDNIYRIALTPSGYSLYQRKTMKDILLSKHDFEWMRKTFANEFDKASEQLLLFKRPEGAGWGEKLTSNSIKSYDDRAVCSAFRHAVIILPDGKVAGCEELYWNKDFIIGDVKINTIENIWKSPKRKNIIFPKQSDFPEDSPCRYCDEKIFINCHNVKGRCWRESAKFFGRTDMPDVKCPYYKEIAEKNNLKIKYHSLAWGV